jgi:hypothetical protein
MGNSELTHLLSRGNIFRGKGTCIPSVIFSRERQYYLEPLVRQMWFRSLFNGRPPSRYSKRLIRRRTRWRSPNIGSQHRIPINTDELRARLKSRQERIEELKAVLANSGETRYKQLDESQRALHHAAFVTNAGDPHYCSLEELSFEDAGKQLTMTVPKGDIPYQFRKDVGESIEHSNAEASVGEDLRPLGERDLFAVNLLFNFPPAHHSSDVHKNAKQPS